MESKEIRDKLIGLYFSKTYWGGSQLSKEEEEWLGNTIKVKPHLNGGYESSKEWIKKNLDLDKEYTLKDMSVGQSSSSLTLEEVPGKGFNTVNFTYRLNV